MSSARRASSASLASESSSRRRWRMSCCDFAGSDQRLGSAAMVFSISASWERREAASKIAPQVMDLAAYSGVFAFEFFYHNCDLRCAGFQHGTRGNPGANQQRQTRDYHTYPGKEIAVADVERGLHLRGIRRNQCGLLISFRFLHDPPVGINGRRDSVVGREQDPAVGLNRPHAGLVQMLKGRTSFCCTG